jgi:hypothetical protein
MNKFEQKLIRHDYKTCQTSDFQFHFHRTCILKNANIMETKLYNRLLLHNLQKKYTAIQKQTKIHFFCDKLYAAQQYVLRSLIMESATVYKMIEIENDNRLVYMQSVAHTFTNTPLSEVNQGEV